jgi:hypothetical protein
MRYKIKVEYQTTEKIISVYYMALGSSLENAVESLTTYVNNYAQRYNSSVVSVLGITE